MFLESTQLQAAVKDILRESKILTLSAAKHHIIISYLAAQLIYMNVQCPGVVQFIETTEYINRQERIGYHQCMSPQNCYSKGTSKNGGY